MVTFTPTSNLYCTFKLAYRGDQCYLQTCAMSVATRALT